MTSASERLTFALADRYLLALELTTALGTERFLREIAVTAAR